MLLKSAESTEFCESHKSTESTEFCESHKSCESFESNELNESHESNESNESKLSDDYAKNLTLYERVHKEYALLSEQIPYPKCALNFKNPFELLVATVLSAQTTDKRVNLVTKNLFSEFPDAFSLSKASISKVEYLIHSLGFYRVKAQHIITLSMQLVEKYNGVVPNTMKELTSLSGVGRKTANVVLGNAFGIPGFPVDTHVIRVTGRLHWRKDWNSSKVNPVKIESEITSFFSPEEWTNVSHRLILHGRTVCTARNPHCFECPLRFTCPSAKW